MKLTINNISIVHVHNNVNTDIKVTPLRKTVKAVLEPENDSTEYTIVDDRQPFADNPTLADLQQRIYEQALRLQHLIEIYEDKL